MHEGVRKAVFQKYRVAGGGYKKNTRCPNCGSTDRARLMYLFFNFRTDALQKKPEILHISPNKLVGKMLYENKNVKYTCGALYPEQFA